MAARLGARRTLSKPFGQKEVLAAVAETLGTAAETASI
jgi:hypothetical protein